MATHPPPVATGQPGAPPSPGLAAAIAANLSAVRSRIALAARTAGRNPEEIRLVAISKTFGIEHVRAAVAAGQTEFGENRVQEALQKIAVSTELGIRWHFVGHLQSNKAGQGGRAVRLDSRRGQPRSAAQAGCGCVRPGDGPQAVGPGGLGRRGHEARRVPGRGPRDRRLRHRLPRGPGVWAHAAPTSGRRSGAGTTLFQAPPGASGRAPGCQWRPVDVAAPVDGNEPRFGGRHRGGSHHGPRGHGPLRPAAQSLSGREGSSISNDGRLTAGARVRRPERLHLKGECS